MYVYVCVCVCVCVHLVRLIKENNFIFVVPFVVMLG